MVKLIYLSENDDRCRYSYQPEETGEPGIIEVDKENGSAYLLKLAEKDNEYSMFYRGPVLKALQSFVENKEYPKEYTRHWY